MGFQPCVMATIVSLKMGTGVCAVIVLACRSTSPMPGGCSQCSATAGSVSTPKPGMPIPASVATAVSSGFRQLVSEPGVGNPGARASADALASAPRGRRSGQG